MKAIVNIYLSWRKGKGFRRHIVGILKRNVTQGVRFEYINDAILSASKDGFVPLVDFPDISKSYHENVLEIFGQRLVKAERSDIQKHYDFWELDNRFINDKYYMLGYTQGMLSTDNFEFLADFVPKENLCFVTEITGLTNNLILPNVINVGDELRWVKESNNQFDKYAVKVFKNDFSIGYIKKIHNRVFHKITKGKLKIIVKSVDQNETINRIFIRVSSF